MKIGFVVTAHHSDKFRVDGGKFIDKFCRTLNEYCNFSFNLYVVDNASTYKLLLPENAIIIRIDDQTKEGITGAWNEGIYKAYDDDCDIIINCSDDQWFNETINVFIDFIKKDFNKDVIYGVLSDGMLPHESQLSDKPLAGTQFKSCTNLRDVPNGFCFAMTNEHYKKYRFKYNKYFNINNKYNNGDGKWGGQEGQFIENSKKGLTGLIVNECWLPHAKVRGWKVPRNEFPNKVEIDKEY